MCTSDNDGKKHNLKFFNKSFFNYIESITNEKQEPCPIDECIACPIE